MNFDLTFEEFIHQVDESIESGDISSLFAKFPQNSPQKNNPLDDHSPEPFSLKAARMRSGKRK